MDFLIKVLQCRCQNFRAIAFIKIKRFAYKHDTCRDVFYKQINKKSSKGCSQQIVNGHSGNFFHQSSDSGWVRD